MAYSEITLIKCTDMATDAAGGLSSVYSVKCVSGAANGAYVKCTGIDPTRILFKVTRNSSQSNSAFAVDVVNGSTSGNIDFEPGKYSTLRNFRVAIAKATNFKDKGSTSDGSWNAQYFKIPDVSRFLDTDYYLKMQFPAGLTSATNKCHGANIAAIYLPG